MQNSFVNQITASITCRSHSAQESHFRPRKRARVSNYKEISLKKPRNIAFNHRDLALKEAMCKCKALLGHRRIMVLEAVLRRSLLLKISLFVFKRLPLDNVSWNNSRCPADTSSAHSAADRMVCTDALWRLSPSRLQETQLLFALTQKGYTFLNISRQSSFCRLGSHFSASKTFSKLSAQKILFRIMAALRAAWNATAFA